MKNSGFTLVELSIVMIIIGLLIGGILKGQELIQNARISSTIAQVKGYSAATLTFQDSYGSLPGDIVSATTLVPDCNAANFCGGGNGNLWVGLKDQLIYSLDQAGVNTLPEAETTYYWKHLLLAGLINNLQPNGNPTAPAWDVTHPSNNLVTGGFTVFNADSDRDAGRGICLRMQKYPTRVNGDWQRVIEPLIAQKIDTKMDDGNPNFGSVQADYDGTNCDTGGRYQVTSRSPVCVMFFQLY